MGSTFYTSSIHYSLLQVGTPRRTHDFLENPQQSKLLCPSSQESLSKTHCLQLFFLNSSLVDPHCVVDQPEHDLAETLEQVEHVFGYISIGILVIFLVENTLLMIAFGRNFAKAALDAAEENA